MSAKEHLFEAEIYFATSLLNQIQNKFLLNPKPLARLEAHVSPCFLI